MKTFAMKLREERDKRALKQIELAELLGVSMRMIGDYENDRRRPHRKKLKQFAEILGLPYGYLADDRYETVAAFFNGTMDDTPAEEKYVPMPGDADAPLSVPKIEGVSPRAEQEMSFIQAHAHALFAGADLPQEAKDKFFESLYDSYLMCRAKAQASGMDVDKIDSESAESETDT